MTGRQTLMMLAGLAVSSLLTQLSAAAERAAAPRVFEEKCAVCHAEGSAFPGTSRLKENGDPMPVLAAKTDLDADMIRQAVRHGLGSMPALSQNTLSNADLDLVVQYLTKR